MVQLSILFLLLYEPTQSSLRIAKVPVLVMETKELQMSRCKCAVGAEFANVVIGS